MAIRKPTAPAEKSAVFAEFLAGAGKDNSAAFKTGSKVEGTVSAVKGDDVFVDIGYKSEGIVSLGEFSDPAEVKPGLKFQVKLLDLEDERRRTTRSAGRRFRPSTPRAASSPAPSRARCAADCSWTSTAWRRSSPARTWT